MSAASPLNIVGTFLASGIAIAAEFCHTGDIREKSTAFPM
jgi:hypothetical protein